jgi:uncharacterized protein
LATHLEAMQKILIWLITGYRLIVSPYLAPHCRFTPSCSEYALIAITQHGTLRGFMLAIKRLLRCHPWHPGGYDPVPERKEKP